MRNGINGRQRHFDDAEGHRRGDDRHIGDACDLQLTRDAMFVRVQYTTIVIVLVMVKHAQNSRAGEVQQAKDTDYRTPFHGAMHTVAVAP